MAFEFQCVRCRSPIADTDVDLEGGHVSCRSCGRVYRSADPTGVAPPRGPVPLPPGMVAKDTEESLFVGFRRLRPTHLFFIGGALAIDLIVALIFRDLAASRPHWTTYLLAPGTYNAVAVILNYLALAALLNRTHLWVKAGRITLRRVPLPCGPTRKVNAAEVDQLFSRAEYEEGRISFCSVCVLLKNGRWLTLVEKLTSVEQAFFLEWAIERHLGIEDRPVAGEIHRKAPG
jgi:hypothetical protein